MIKGDQFTHMFKILSSKLQREAGSREPVFISFYPYSGIRHTIRYRNLAYHIRLSDILAEAPEEVLYAISAHLLMKIRRMKSPPEMLEPYENYIRSLELHQLHKELKRTRGRVPRHDPRGNSWDLEMLFKEVNRLYLNDQVEPVGLRWSGKPSVRVLGRWEPAHNVITISRALDRPEIPLEVMYWIMAHEMLHILIPVKKSKNRYSIHPPEFRERERALPVYSSAMKWLKTHPLRKFSGTYKNPILRAIINS